MLLPLQRQAKRGEQVHRFDVPMDIFILNLQLISIFQSKTGLGTLHHWGKIMKCVEEKKINIDSNIRDGNILSHIEMRGDWLDLCCNIKKNGYKFLSDVNEFIRGQTGRH